MVAHMRGTFGGFWGSDSDLEGLARFTT